jgi:predicted RNA-binding Zn ribbon-like protein
MRLSKRYPVPSELTLLFEFVNSLDMRRFVERGAPHATGDGLATVSQFEDWLRARDLLDAGATVKKADHRKALDLRDALRSFLQLETADRACDAAVAARLNASSAKFPVIVRASGTGKLVLQPAPRPGSSGLGRVLAELHLLSETDRLDRLKMCASEECRWVFYDRSKPGSRRWCSSALCGNRQKTRAYRQRRRESGL